MKLIISRGPKYHSQLPSANHQRTVPFRRMPLPASYAEERSDSSQIHLAVLCDRPERGHALQIEGRPKEDSPSRTAEATDGQPEKDEWL